MTQIPQTTWTPNRQDIIWIDCNPQVGQTMRDAHPFLVLPTRIFNEKTALIIGLPMTTAAYNADNPFAVAVGKAEQTVMCSAINQNLSTGVCVKPNRIR